MNRTLRAAGFAAALFGFAISIGTGVNGPEGGASLIPSAQATPALGSLEAQVSFNKMAETADAEQDCLASAVYFEARGEPLEGQLAVAEVVLNRVASPRYPDTICAVVEQPWQFSFVNATGRIPAADRSSDSWRKAVAIARIAQAGTADVVESDVLWYHADYVSPSWGRRLARQEKIGLHIFYS
jgi:spore germination cell wall hydrolase CwlJ-like protein